MQAELIVIQGKEYHWVHIWSDSVPAFIKIEVINAESMLVRIVSTY